MANTSTKWVLDPAHSELNFRVKHLKISNVKGEFRNFNAVIGGDDFFTSTIRVSVETSSVFTNDEKRDAHLRSADFFDSDNFKEMLFESVSFKKKSNETYQLDGNLTIKGITKAVSLVVEYGGTEKDPWGVEKAAFELEAKIKRSDWNLNWNAVLETGGVLVSDEVRIMADVQFSKQAE